MQSVKTLAALCLLLCYTVKGFVVFHRNQPWLVSKVSETGLFDVRKDAGMTPDQRDVAMSKATKAMTAFTNTYLKNTGTKLCADKSVPAVVIKGLAEHKVTLGAPLCPCRFYDDKEAEVKDGYWNCPCVPMRERHECHCMLFLTESSAFVGEETSITVDDVLDASQGIRI